MIVHTEPTRLTWRTPRPYGFDCDVPRCTGVATHWSGRDDVRLCGVHATDPKAVRAAAEAQSAPADEDPGIPLEVMAQILRDEAALQHAEATRELGPGYVTLQPPARSEEDVAIDGAAAFAEFAGDPPPRGSCPYHQTIAPMLARLDHPEWIEPRHVEALMRVEWGTLDARPLSDFRRYARIAAASTDEDRGLLDDLAESYGI